MRQDPSTQAGGLALSRGLTTWAPPPTMVLDRAIGAHLLAGSRPVNVYHAGVGCLADATPRWLGVLKHAGDRWCM